MTLRARLFLLFGGLVALLVLGQWALVSMLTERLSAEVGEVAVSVGRGLISDVGEQRILRLNPEAPGAKAADDDGHRALLEKLPAGGMERSGRQIAILELEEPDGTTWVQEVLRLEDPKTAVEGRSVQPDATAVFTYQISVDAPQGARNLLVQGPEGGRAIPIPGVGVQRAVEQAGNRLLLGTGLILLLGLLAAGLVAHRVTAPLRGLAGAARTLGAGALGAQAPEQGSGEVREAILSFNRMSSHLRQLDETNRRLRGREHLTEIGEIARGLAHTLRNPLNALGLSVEELAGRAGAQDEALELAQAARRQIRRIDGAIRSFLALASEGGGTVEEVDLGALVQDVALEAAQDAARDVALEVADPGRRITLRAVSPELRAVVQALVVNAVEASPDGGRVTVRLERRPDEGGCRVLVADEGPGLPAEVRERLFTPHVTTKANGSGMGLYLAQRIAANRYGGTVRLEDKPEGGTEAILELGPREEMGRG